MNLLPSEPGAPLAVEHHSPPPVPTTSLSTAPFVRRARLGWASGCSAVQNRCRMIPADSGLGGEQSSVCCVDDQGCALRGERALLVTLRTWNLPRAVEKKR